MNAAKVTLVSTILAAALGLALGLGAAPALAGPPDEEGCHDHKVEECPVGGDVTLFTVILDGLVASGTGTSAIDCPGTTDIQANPGLTVDFEQDCSVELTFNSVPFDVSLFRLEGKIKGSGVTEIRLYFTTESMFGEKCLPCPNDTIWVTDKLDASIADDPNFDGVFVLSEIMPEPQKLIKIHRPDRGAETTDDVEIGLFTYTPIE